MKIKLESKSVQSIISSWDKIDPKPQYQRTPVWKIDRKRLLIDSIIRGYDLPKFYMSKLQGNVLYDYEVCDGQQRLRTIHEYCNNEYALGKENSYNGKHFSDLDDSMQKGILNYELTFALIIDADQREIRDLFARLQRGMGLNQAELRRALSTNIGVFVESIVDNHKFFKSSGILDIRNKCQDYIDHVIAYFINGFSKDFKGNFLKEVYEQISADKASEFVKDISKVLDEMEKINNSHLGIFKNKWGFVDTFILIHHFLEQKMKISTKEFGLEFVAFELLRRKNVKNPSSLIEKSSSSEEERRLYIYLTSFQKDGALKNNMRKRHEVFIEQFGHLFE